MKFRWHGEAKVEADAAATFYNEKQPGLAQRFLDDLEDALHRIQRHPQAYRHVEGEIRKCRVAHFPYGVIYRVHRDHRRDAPATVAGILEGAQFVNETLAA